MFPANAVRSKVASLLHPFLEQHPDLDIQLGFLKSSGTAHNLLFNPAALNPLIENSSNLLFKQFKIRELILRVRPWSVPSVIIQVSGVNVILAPRETVGGRRASARDSDAKKRKEAVASFDPEGASLHEIIERISARAYPGNQLSATLANVMLRCCQIQFQDLHIKLQFINESHACLLKVDKVSFETQILDQISFFRGLVGSLFLSGKECVLDTSCSCMELGLMVDDHVYWITSLMCLSACVTLNNLHPLDYDIQIPVLNFNISPAIIPVLLVLLDVLSSKEFESERSGQELWKKASEKIGHWTLTWKLSLCKVVDMVLLWLQYIRAYESLLLAVGYSADTPFVENVARVSSDHKLLNHVRHQWKLIYELEEKLPTEAVARGRRIARHRALSYSSLRDSESTAVLTSSALNIFAVLVLLWKAIQFIFQSIVSFSFIWGILSVLGATDSSRSLGGVSNDPCSELRFRLSLGEVSVTLSSEKINHNEKLESATKLPGLEFTSFCFTMKCLCLVFTTDITTKSFFMALGEVRSCLSSKVSLLKSDFRSSRIPSYKGLKLERGDHSKIILWSNPALLHHPSQENAGDPSCHVSSVLTSSLENNIQDLWSNWEKIRREYEDVGVKCNEQPFVLCELKYFIMAPYVRKGDSGLSKCSLAFGKLNFGLEHSSILSIALIFRQMQHYYQWTTGFGRMQTSSGSPSVMEENSQIRGESMIDLYSKRMKATLLNIIPDKNIQIAAHIAGPTIQLSLQNALLAEDNTATIAHGNSGYCFSIDMVDIEFVVCPGSESALAHLTTESSFNEASHYLCLKSQKVDIPKPHSNERFISRGCIALDGCLRFGGPTVTVDELKVNEQSQIAKPMSMALQFSTCREYIHSLTGTVNILSVATSGIGTGASFSLYMDELWTFHQILEGMFLVVLSDFNSSTYLSHGYSEDFIRKLRTPARKDTEMSVVESEVTSESMIFNSTEILVDVTLEFQSVDMTLNDTRRRHLTGASVEPDGASSSATPYLSISPARRKSTILGMLDLPGFGVGVFMKKSCIKISCERNLLDLAIDVCGIQSLIFSHQNVLGVCTDASQIKSLLEQSSEGLYQFIISNCSSSLHLGSCAVSLPSANDSDSIDGSGSEDFRPSFVMDGASAEGSSNSCCVLDQKLEAGDLITTRTPAAVPGCWAVVDIQLGEISMLTYGIKHQLTGTSQPNNSRIWISICEEMQIVDCKIQGGYIFLETASLAMFIDCFQAYFLLISKLVLHEHRESSSKAGISMVSKERVPQPTNFSSEEYAMGSSSPTSTSGIQKAFKWNFLKSISVYLSEFSIIFAVKDESESTVQELIIEADMSLKLWSSTSKLVFVLNGLSIFTRHLHNYMSYRTRDLLIPHFHANKLVDMPSPISSGHCNFPSGDTESVARPHVARSMQPPTPPRDNLLENGMSDSALHSSYILKRLTASLTVEERISESEVHFVQLKSDIVGSGFISGIDLTISLSEIQMLSALFAPLCETFSAKEYHNVKQNTDSRMWEPTGDLDTTIPDGAVVAIKDLHEHMFFAVEAIDNKYHLTGVLHYTLVGERALFRVKYHRRWNSQVPWISLISLVAKNDQGEPLRLNCIPGSGFVEISSSNDKRWALWQTFPYKPDSYEDGDEDGKSYNTATRKAFHLVNQKNSCAVAFVDGLPEFVKKPGNPFKVKVLSEFVLPSDRGLTVYNGESSDTYIQQKSSVVGEASEFSSNLPYVNITIDKVILTILHEVSDENDKVPLFRGIIDGNSIIGQMLSSKFRVMSSFSVAIQHMDARKNLWMDIVTPVGAHLFFRSRFVHQDFGTPCEGVPSHFYFSMSQVDLSLTEISFDILLYLAGKLNIAGPYAVRNSVIFPNCCKLQNHSGLGLICHFPDSQDTVIAGKQSASIFLRQVAEVDRLTENKKLVSVCLAKHGVFSTSPLNVSLSNDCLFAWRTRIVSLQDSRSFPGPLVVVEVSHKTEEGLSLAVTPLLRICNESGFPMELRFRRPQETEGESAIVLLRNGDTIDDSMAAFDALELSGGSKRALTSLTLGNFLLSFRPEMTEYSENNGQHLSMEWSEDVQGEKAVRVSGIYDSLNYRFRKAFGVESGKSFFSCLHCPLTIEGQHISDMHFLVQSVGRDVPVMQPPNAEDTSEIQISPVALQVQKEIFICPTVQVYNLLQTEILVLLTEDRPDLCMTGGCNNIGKQATISCGSSAYLYANPAMIYFTVTLTAYGTRCKPVSSATWVKKLNKQKSNVQFLETELEFEGGKYSGILRLSRANRGILEVTIFTSYTLQNNTELSLLCSASNVKTLTWEEIVNYGSNFPPELGCFLPPKSTGSWFLKTNKVLLKGLQEKTSAAVLDLDVLSGFTELCLEAQDDLGFSRVTKLGVSLQPCLNNVSVPSQMICIVPRHIIANQSKECISVRQCNLQDGVGEVTSIEYKQKVALSVRTKTSKRRETGFLQSILKRQKNVNEDSQIFIQFCLKELGYSWSGPICIASLGRFFLKFKRSSETLVGQSNPTTRKEKKSTRFAAVQIVEENSCLVLHFYLPANVALPYRIENCLHGSSVMYYQKDSEESDMLTPGESVEYVWDDLNLPHKLVVQIIDLQLLREINIDKICSWKPLFKMRQHKGLVLHLPMDKGFGNGKGADESSGFGVFKVGYEVYADGLTRVLRICEASEKYKEEKMLQPCVNIQFRVSHFFVHLLEDNEQAGASRELPIYSTIIVARLSNIALDFLVTDQYKYHRLRVQSLSVDEKWQGAPFASMVRRSQLHDSCSSDSIFHITFILRSTNSNVKQVEYSSIILQPVDLKVDEETLMRLVPFWRTSLSDSRTQSQQFYFKHLEIHPIKITASFLPGNPHSNYSSAQETLRSLLHSVIKVPTVNNTVVELNGILLTHVLVTFRELLMKCVQHYSWYVIRAVYVAKGSPLLPPAFASIFDDSASSSLDIFFDPSDGSVSLPGLTLGMFKFVSKCIDSKGFSGTKRYFGDLGKTIKIAGSNALFAAVTEISDSILRGAEGNGFNGMINGFHQGIMRLAMEPSFLGAAVLEGGPDRKIKLDRSPGVDELYIEGYLQAMLDVIYKQEYLRVRVVDNQVVLKNLPPNSSVINEIVENVKSFLVSKALLKGDASTASRPLRHLRSESEWRIGPTVLTLCEHLFVSFTIRILRKQANRALLGIRWNGRVEDTEKGDEASSEGIHENHGRMWAVGRFVFSGMIAYLDGRLCRHIPNPIARRIVSGFLLSYLDKRNGE